MKRYQSITPAMIHDGIRGSQLVIVDEVDHAFIWAHPGEFVRMVKKFPDG